MTFFSSMYEPGRVVPDQAEGLDGHPVKDALRCLKSPSLVRASEIHQATFIQKGMPVCCIKP